MSSLDPRLIPNECWIRAADHLVRHAPSDLLPDLELDARCRQSLIEQLCEGGGAEHSSFCDWNALQVLIPRSWPAFRQAHLLSPGVDLGTIAGAMWLGGGLDRFRLPKEDQIVFSYRLDETGNSWFAPSLGWSQYQQHSLECAQTSGHVLTADISGFYSSIRPIHFAHVARCIGSKVEEGAVLDGLVDWLVHECWGMPVGGDAARVMAEWVMIPVDVEMQDAGLNFVRFVDDYRFFAQSREDVERVLFDATRILASHGFQWNKGKLKVWKAEDFIEREQFHSVVRISDGESGVEVSNNHFDPYSELVYHRAAELRKEMGVVSLSGALSQELEKVRPSLSNVKVLLAAIPISDIHEKKACLELLTGSFISGWMVQVLPHVYRMLRKLEWLRDLDCRDSVCLGLESAMLSSQSRTPYELGFLIHCYRRISGGHLTHRLAKALDQIRSQSCDVFLLREVVYSLLVHEPTRSREYFAELPIQSVWLQEFEWQWARFGRYNLD